MKRVGVIRGGSGGYYNESLASGKNILEALTRLGKYEKVDILVDKAGKWHIGGIEVLPSEIDRNVDVVFNALHKSYHHQDNSLSILEGLRVPFTGSMKLAHSVANNRTLSKTLAWKHGLSVPQALLVERNEDLNVAAKDIFNTLSGKLVLKPVGGTVGGDVETVSGIRDLPEKLEIMLEVYPEVIVEEYISGKEAIVPVIENFRNESHYTPFPVEVIQSNGKRNYLTPGFFSESQKRDLGRFAREIHKAAGSRHYSMSHFVIHPSGRIYFIKKETHPSLSPDAPLMQALDSVGCRPEMFVDHIVNLAY